MILYSDGKTTFEFEVRAGGKPFELRTLVTLPPKVKRGELVPFVQPKETFKIIVSRKIVRLMANVIAQFDKDREEKRAARECFKPNAEICGVEGRAENGKYYICQKRSMHKGKHDTSKRSHIKD